MRKEGKTNAESVRGALSVLGLEQQVFLSWVKVVFYKWGVSTKMAMGVNLFVFSFLIDREKRMWSKQILFVYFD